ncbi:hypothetical protein DMC14_000955 [Metamycoplasma phocicerebrale]|uniref:Uncharacterized protein n=1 Tax=Metamycoplasma phocicerebrale TaxID=142649 RepID=A0A3Q9V8Z7_9BACT|nr:hypothetical protein [Metamycoplasma phocicerebrale]AZZ65362.1 hypothetical protein DMC14_000955 [Metamycoplasma phocicerebrale]
MKKRLLDLKKDVRRVNLSDLNFNINSLKTEQDEQTKKIILKEHEYIKLAGKIVLFFFGDVRIKKNW